MFPTKSIINEESNLFPDGSTVYIDSFTSVIQRAVAHNILLLRQKSRPTLVMKKTRSSFRKEIRCMMHTFGDVENPLKDSVCLVEKILRNQMNLLLKKVTRVSIARKRTYISHEELVYLLRKKKAKLRRLLQYLSLKDANEFIAKKNFHHISGVINGKGRRVKLCVDFLNELNKTKEFDHLLSKSIKDPVTTKRVKMRYIRTLDMEDDQYLEYSKKLQVSFLPVGGAERFKKWLLEDNPTNLVINDLALEILSYLARETVAEVVESSSVVQINCQSPDSLQRNLNTGDLRTSHAEESCHAEQSDSANLSSHINSNVTGNISTDCVNDFINQSGERNHDSIFQNDSYSTQETIMTNGSHDNDSEEEGDNLSSVGLSTWVFDIKLTDAKNSPIHPRSIREFMHRSRMSPKFLNAHVSKSKIKERLLCL